jgi:Tol biopolymer transport system component
MLGSTAAAQVTQRVSVATGGAQANAQSLDPQISADGRVVVFSSLASNLDSSDTNGNYDAFVHDLMTGGTRRVSNQPSGQTFGTSISGDGRKVVLQSLEALVAGDLNSVTDVYVHDMSTGTLDLVSVSTGGVQGNLDSSAARITPDGRFVVFASAATNLVAGDTNGKVDVFVRDLVAQTTVRASLTYQGGQAQDHCLSGSISGDGTRVAFQSAAMNLVPNSLDLHTDVFVRDLVAGTTTRVSQSAGGVEGNLPSVGPVLSADGRFVAFSSDAANLVPGDTNGWTDVFVCDLASALPTRISISSSGAQADSTSDSPSISADGRFVAFRSWGTNLVPGDTNAVFDVFVRDLSSGTTERVSLDSTGSQVGGAGSFAPSISADGQRIAFRSYSPTLVPGDTNGVADDFVRDRNATGFTSLCDPGVQGVSACPCSNPPGGPGRGCDNSSATGGAILSAAGIAYLSMDSLVFTTSAEEPAATSIVMQGDALVPTGLVFGQGVRCVGGTLERLYTQTAVSGSIRAPDLGAGDPTVSARSASLGDVIQAGQSRWYLVYYRDPIVPGGCPAASTFNATQTGQVFWSL